MAAIGAHVPVSNASNDLGFYILYSTVKSVNTIIDKLVLVLFAIALLLNFIQTFWKNKFINRFLFYLMEVYSDGRLKSTIVSYRQQIFTCYQFDQRFSHIPCPKRLILFIICIHIQILLLITTRTLFIRKSELVNDCYTFPRPYEILQCEQNKDPCRLNGTESIPKCTFYHFELSNFITMVTSVVTWHYALRYFIVKLMRFIQWALFSDDDQLRKCCCYFQMKTMFLRCLMYFHYVLLWLYLLTTIVVGFRWDISAVYDVIPSDWRPVSVTVERLCLIVLATIPELLQNWLEATLDGKALEVFHFQGRLLNNAEPLTYLINNKELGSDTIENKS